MKSKKGKRVGLYGVCGISDLCFIRLFARKGKGEEATVFQLLETKRNFRNRKTLRAADRRCARQEAEDNMNSLDFWGFLMLSGERRP